MARILVVFYSRTGNTAKMAEEVARGAKEAGADVVMKPVEDASVDEMTEADGVILGSPTYYGHSSGPMRTFLDESVRLHGKLGGKIGGAFASSANIGGGNETTVLDLLHALLIHGMIIEGTSDGDHYGPVSIGAPDDRVVSQCRALGKRVAGLAERLAT
jgi:NAD(P)H dehydrogenase (quinone)